MKVRQKILLLGAGALIIGASFFGIYLAASSAYRWFTMTPMERALAVSNPVPFEASENQVQALFGYQDLLRVDSKMPLPNSPVRMHGQDEWDGAWYIDRSEGEMDLPGCSVDCALDVSGSADSGSHQFGIWLSMSGVESGRFFSGQSFDVEAVALDWGDDSAAGVLFEDGRAVGNIVVVRKGKRVAYMYWKGLSLSSGIELLDLIAPSLGEMMALER